MKVWSSKRGSYETTADIVASEMTAAEWDVFFRIANKESFVVEPSVRELLKEKKLATFTWAGGTRPDYANLSINAPAVLETDEAKRRKP